jgi:hypothetical protein
MATDNILRSYGDAAIPEGDVSALVEILTAKENYFLNNLQKEATTNTVDINLTDTLASAASQAVEESADYTYLANTTPTRVNNIVQLVSVPFKVSNVQQWVDHYTGKDELARQTAKRIIDWANSAEFDLVRSTLTSGASGTTAKMSGVIEAISRANNTTAHNSGTALTATIIKLLMRDNWDNSNGEVATDLFMGSFLKNVLDNISGIRSSTAAVIINAADKSMVDVVDKYKHYVLIKFGYMRETLDRHFLLSGIIICLQVKTKMIKTIRREDYLRGLRGKFME